MLIVYDFEGGSTDDAAHHAEALGRLRRSCEVSSDSAPCWGTAVDLTDARYRRGGGERRIRPLRDTIGRRLATRRWG